MNKIFALHAFANTGGGAAPAKKGKKPAAKAKAGKKAPAKKAPAKKTAPKRR